MYLGKLNEKDIPKLHAMLDDLNGFTSDISHIYQALKEIETIEHYYLFCLYTADHTLVGTTSLTKCFDLTGDCAPYYSLENFVIDKTERGKGYGSYLLQEVESFIEKEGGRYVNFTSSSLREKAHDFYNKNGYKLDYVKGFKKVFK